MKSAPTSKHNDRIKYRCSMQLLIDQVSNLKFRGDHLAALKKTPFWKIIDFILGDSVIKKHCMVDKSIVRSIVSRYVKGERCFQFGNRQMKLKPKDAKLIFGINDGKKKIDISFFKFERSNFLQKCFPEKISKTSKDIRLKPSLIYDRIKEIIESPQQEDVNCIASLTTLLVLVILLVTSKTSYIPWAYTTLVSDLDNITNYNWSKHVVDTLLDSLENAKDCRVERCVLLLPYWLCERSQIVEPIHENYMPRFVKWDLSALPKRLNESNFDAVMNNHNFVNSLKRTRNEMEILWGITRNEGQAIFEAIEGGEINTKEVNLIDVAVDAIALIENTCCKSLRDELIDQEKVVEGLRFELAEKSSMIQAKDKEIENLQSELAMLVEQSSTKVQEEQQTDTQILTKLNLKLIEVIDETELLKKKLLAMVEENDMLKAESQRFTEPKEIDNTNQTVVDAILSMSRDEWVKDSEETESGDEGDATFQIQTKCVKRIHERNGRKRKNPDDSCGETGCKDSPKTYEKKKAVIALDEETKETLLKLYNENDGEQYVSVARQTSCSFFKDLAKIHKDDKLKEAVNYDVLIPGSMAGGHEDRRLHWMLLVF